MFNSIDLITTASGWGLVLSREFFSVRYAASYYRCYLHLQICDKQMLAKVLS
jgi:hypothetical protein